MAEYVNTIFVERMLESITDDKELIANAMDSLPIAEVIERFKVDEAIEDSIKYRDGVKNDFCEAEVGAINGVIDIFKNI